MRNCYPLWAFYADGKIILTRGKNQQEALNSLMPCLEVGTTVALLNEMPVSSGRAYSSNHPFDWLHTPPRYLKQTSPAT